MSWLRRRGLAGVFLRKASLVTAGGHAVSGRHVAGPGATYLTGRVAPVSQTGSSFTASGGGNIPRPGVQEL